ncbi:MAG: hypothetical protein IK108_00705 [Clostridia bacterium]|nr:hypothetical protein [Clostridia bacterium]
MGGFSASFSDAASPSVRHAEKKGLSSFSGLVSPAIFDAISSTAPTGTEKDEPIKTRHKTIEISFRILIFVPPSG